MNTRIDAVYGRQSVDKKDSISIESQIEFCKYELKGGNFKEYTDKGYSGKNTERPRFQELVRDIERGLIGRVVVYKLDRISRSIIDFARMMELFQRYNVEFISSTEKFDTSTPMGRAMLNICIVFAQLERETIQKRVTDAYYSRCQKGFHMSGKAPYGFTLTPTVLDGIRTKMMEVDPIAAERVKLMFEMYVKPETSYGDIARYFAANNLDFSGNELYKKTLSLVLRNPIYVQADLEIYEFFKSQGTYIVNDAADFTGTNGCYLYQGRDVAERKAESLKDQILVIAPHEGLIPSETWLACRKKMLGNTSFSTSVKAKNTWLAGKIKCSLCGAGLSLTHNQSGYMYFRCRKRAEWKTCKGCDTMRTLEVEQFIHDEMRQKMIGFQTLTGGNPMKANPKLTALSVELAQVEAEIEKLLDTLTGANATLLTYANNKIEELDTRRQGLIKSIADMTAEAIPPEKINRISNFLDNRETTDFDDKRHVLDALVTRIKATSDNIQIEWKI
jgi:DNA invertase Pin-like site-specific DNA recombinase/organic radical activating enzyme